MLSCGDAPQEENLGGEVRDRHRIISDQFCPIHETPLWKIESFGETVCYAQPYGAWLQSDDVPSKFPYAVIGERNLRKDHSPDAEFPMYHLACEECEKASSESWRDFVAAYKKPQAEHGSGLKGLQP